jgi:hypothetical protein
MDLIQDRGNQGTVHRAFRQQQFPPIGLAGLPEAQPFEMRCASLGPDPDGHHDGYQRGRDHQLPHRESHTRHSHHWSTPFVGENGQGSPKPKNDNFDLYFTAYTGLLLQAILPTGVTRFD